jgi:hypothetical protein
MDSKFIEFRNSIISSLNKYDIAYAVFGGAAVQLINNERYTNDIDIAVKNDRANIFKFIEALADSGFATYNELCGQIFEDNNPDSVELYSTYLLWPTKLEWKEFHLDLCINIGDYRYETMPVQKYKDGDLALTIVDFGYIAKMKANIFPKPRPKDIEDILSISDYLGLDPSTGEPIKKKASPADELFRNRKKKMR